MTRLVRTVVALALVGCTSPMARPLALPDAAPLADAGEPGSPPDAAPDLFPDLPIAADASVQPPDAAADLAPDLAPDAPPDAPPPPPDLRTAPVCPLSCTVGAVECGASGPRSCVLGEDGCTAWHDEAPCRAGQQCRAGLCGCPSGQIWCDSTNRCHVPVICLVEYDGGSLNLTYQHLTAFCPAAPGGSARPEASGLVRPGRWQAAADDGTCTAFVAEVKGDLCGGAPPGKQLGERRLSYDASTGELVTGTPEPGPTCP